MYEQEKVNYFILGVTQTGISIVVRYSVLRETRGKRRREEEIKGKERRGEEGDAEEKREESKGGEVRRKRVMGVGESQRKRKREDERRQQHFI